MSDRSEVLGTIRRSIEGSAVASGAPTTLSERASNAFARIAARKRGTTPARSLKPRLELLDDFIERVEKLAGSVERINRDDLPEAVARYLRAHNLPPRIRCAPEELLEGADWSKTPMIDVTTGVPDLDDTVAVNVAFKAAAETGTLMMCSDASSPTTLNFLPPTHIAVLRASDLVGPYEDALDALRAEQVGAKWGGRMPRSVNFITGPSRTGDIEQKILLGAHGPKALHVLVLDDA